jgi:CheY-like chemotaxis protein
VVDDYAAVRSALKFSLEVAGLDVRVFDGAAGLLNDSAALPCDCLVVDYRMPGVDGLELIGVLRSRRYRGIGHPDQRPRQQGIACPGPETRDPLPAGKPLSDDSLLDSIRSMLALAG